MFTVYMNNNLAINFTLGRRNREENIYPWRVLRLGPVPGLVCAGHRAGAARVVQDELFPAVPHLEPLRMLGHRNTHLEDIHFRR